MISHNFKCIYVHIPKVAGQSIEQFFLNLDGKCWEDREYLLLRSNNNPQKGPTSLSHLKASEYTKFGYIDQKSFEDYYKFGFVRNPWDRLVSTYKYRGYMNQFSFTDYVNKYMPEEGPQKEQLHIVPQYKFLFDENMQPLVDYIGRFENLQQDFEIVASHLNIEQKNLPHKNKSNEAATRQSIKEKIKNIIIHRAKSYHSYRDFYNKKTREKVSRLYEKDIEIFNYTF